MNSTRKKKRPKFANLDPNYNLRSRWEQTADVAEYAHKLDNKDKEWLNRFMGEYVNGSFEKRNDNNIHKSKKLKKDCYDRNNARNRDILTKSKAMGNTVYLEDLNNKDIKRDYEQNLIDAIDSGFDMKDYYPSMNVKEIVEVVENDDLFEQNLVKLEPAKKKRTKSRQRS